MKPSGNVPLGMQYPPHIDMVGLLKIEDQVWIALELHIAQARQSNFIGKPKRAGCWMAGYQLVGVLKILDVSQRHVRTGFAHIVINGVLDIPQSNASRNDRLRGHLVY